MRGELVDQPAAREPLAEHSRRGARRGSRSRAARSARAPRAASPGGRRTSRSSSRAGRPASLGDRAVADGVDAARRRSAAASSAEEQQPALRCRASRLSCAAGCSDRSARCVGVHMYCTIVHPLTGSTSTAISRPTSSSIGGGVVGAATALAARPRGSAGGPGRALAVEGPSARARAPRGSSPRRPTPTSGTSSSALRALERWREIESEAGQRRCSWPTGALSHGEFAERETSALREAGVEAELLAADEARAAVRRRSAARSPPAPPTRRGDHPRRPCPRRPARAGRAPREPSSTTAKSVRSIWPTPATRVEVETDRRRWRCAAAVVAAGPWSGALLAAAGIELPAERLAAVGRLLRPPRRSAPPVALIEFDGDEPYALLGSGARAQGRVPRSRPDVGDLGDRAGVEPGRGRPPRGVGPRARSRLSAAAPSGVETCIYTQHPRRALHARTPRPDRRRLAPATGRAFSSRPRRRSPGGASRSRSTRRRVRAR